MLASVVIPTYKRPRYLKEAIESACELGGKKTVQIVVVADGCPDASPVVQEFSNRVEFIQLETNSGQSAALNAALPRVRGDYFTVLHDDDRVLPNKLEDLIPTMKTDPRVGGVCSQSESIGRLGDIRDDWNDRRIDAMRLKHESFAGGFVSQRFCNFIQGETVLYRTEAVRSIGGWNEKLPHAEECDLHIRLSCAGWRWRFVDSITAQYRIHDENKSLLETGKLRPSVIDYGRRLRASYRDPIWVSVCSIPKREAGLKDTVEALLPQCDTLNVFLAGYERRPNFLDDKKIQVVRLPKEQDRGTREKFRWVDQMKAVWGGYYITVDDDVLYPPDYVEELVHGIRKYKNKALCSFHGSIFKVWPVQNYFKNRECLHFKEEVSEDRRVHVIGNVCGGFHTGAFELNASHFSDKHYSDDSALSIAAQSQGIPAIVLAHRAGWIEPNPARGCESGLYDEYSKGNESIDRTINSFSGWLAEVAA